MNEPGEPQVNGEHQWHVCNRVEHCLACGVIRHPATENTSCIARPRTDPSMSPVLGWNDGDGTVHCNLCSWSARCTHLEQLEHRLQQHLKQAHSITVLWRRSQDTGQVISIPQ